MAIPRTAGTNKYTFLGREKQPETGYMDLMKRFYDPTVGRFMQVDPVTAEQENYSTYQYGWNNPILRSDPNGDCPNCLVGALIGAASDYGVQVAANLIQGKELGDALTDVDVVSIGASAVLGAATSGLSVLKTGGSIARLGAAASKVSKTEQAVAKVVVASKRVADKVSEAKVKMPNGSELPVPGKGKGSVPPGQRDPKRVSTKSEKQEMLDERGGKCEGCDKPASAKEVQAHHNKRHSDGGGTTKDNMTNLCEDCHKLVHKNGQ